jgi:hypothetical protein
LSAFEAPEDVMAFVTFTRPDDSKVGVNSTEVLSFAPVPHDGALKVGTRIVFINKTQQDVKELVDEVAKRLNAV